jgi:hypothetical protein
MILAINVGEGDVAKSAPRRRCYIGGGGLPRIAGSRGQEHPPRARLGYRQERGLPGKFCRVAARPPERTPSRYASTLSDDIKESVVRPRTTRGSRGTYTWRRAVFPIPVERPMLVSARLTKRKRWSPSHRRDVSAKTGPATTCQRRRRTAKRKGSAGGGNASLPEPELDVSMTSSGGDSLTKPETFPKMASMHCTRLMHLGMDAISTLGAASSSLHTKRQMAAPTAA